MIRIIFRPDNPGAQHETRPDRISMKFSDETNLTDLLEGFRAFCLAVGFQESTWKEVVRDSVVDEGGAAEEKG